MVVKKSLFGLAALFGFALAQGSSGFTVIRTPGADNRITVTEAQTRAVSLQISCVNSQVEVLLDPKIKLPQTQAPLLAWRFDDAPVKQQRWNFVPESGELILPQNLTQQFLEGIADSRQTMLSLPEVSDPVWNATLATTGFRAAFAQLPCSKSFALGSTAPNNPAPMATKVLDATVAFIAPIEFTRAFGGRFEPESGKLAWEYNGRKLVLQVGKTTVQNVYRNTSLELPRPVQVLGGRTVVPARVVSVFDCTLQQTKPTDATVRVTCGAGSTLITRDLPRY